MDVNDVNNIFIGALELWSRTRLCRFFQKC